MSALGAWQEGLRRGGGWWERRPRKGARGLLFWIAIWFAAVTVLRLLPGAMGTMAAVLQAMLLVGAVLVGVPVLWQGTRQRMLWSLRNKLVLTYLLVGLAPVVLFVTLVLVSAYVAAGQFAIHLAATRLASSLDHLSGMNTLDARVLEQRLKTGRAADASDAEAGELRYLEPTVLPRALSTAPTLRVYRNGMEVVSGGGARNGERSRAPLGVPPWASHMEDGVFNGMVLEGKELYLLAMRQVELTPGERYSLISSVPVDQRLMREVAQGLGRAGLVGVMTTTRDDDPDFEQRTAAPGRTGGTRGTAAARRGEQTGDLSPGAAGRRRALTEEVGRSLVFGGAEPVPANVLDFRVRFLSTLPVVDWDTGQNNNVPIEVDSRPSRLYAALFGASLGGIVTQVVRIGLLVLCVVFALIEALALWMAARLSRTVTASVQDLYAATQRIDRGDLQTAIAVERDDQMAELSRSFNGMMVSLQRLIEEQKASQRLQNEVAIAQEVQANLFPRKMGDLPTLELHGASRPARGVSGDYYDFLLLGGDGTGETAGVGIALGDISGKGISAALLMATLHSAVRAYRLASEELTAHAAEDGEERGSGRWGALLDEPGQILSMLNRHLYRSTQPEKYATLFLAHYTMGEDGAGRLTYSTGGQLPPLLLRGDGGVRRLACGGTVVGLMDGMVYEQETVRMEPGDLMVAYSDGVTEPENDFGEFGEERMMEIVRMYRNEPLHVISAQVLLALEAWIGAEEQPDDITLVLARQR